MEVLSHSTEETKELARSIADKLPSNTILALYGDLGSGKTTFTTYLVHALGIDARVQSPTFVISRKYGKVNHLDLYRLEDVRDLDLQEMFDADEITLIEWPDVAEDVLPERTIKIKFEYVDENTRRINVQNLD